MIRRYFEFLKHGTDLKTEILAGVTTYTTMAYLLILVPMMASSIGMPFESVFTACAVTGAFACIFNGIYTKRPFALAPFLGECTFVVYAVVSVMGYRYEQALGAIFICGALFLILTVIKVRPWLVNSIPPTLKLSFTAGLGLFLIFSGLKETGIIQLVGDTMLLGDISNVRVLLAILCCLMMIILTSLKVKSSILVSILSITLVGILIGDVKLPNQIISVEAPSFMPTFFKFDVTSLLNAKGFILIFTFFTLMFVDTMGSLIGLSCKANLLDKKGNLPEIEKPMLTDAISTILASILGTTTTGYCVESATGIEAGGKTGLTSVVVGILFLISLIFAPLLNIIPVYAYAPALIMVGILMATSLSSIKYEDYTEYLPAIIMILLILFTSNFGVGMSVGFILYPILKLVNKKYSDNNLAVWILFVLGILFFVICY